MTHGSLFSGIGGWSVASDQMGWTTLFCCEWNENKQYVLKHHWPKSKIYGDITKTDFTIWRGRIDILTASTPCQPFSLAGKREGANDVRHLWPETLRTIREIQPPFFVLENVPGLVNWSKGMVFKQIIIDLENEGYEVLPFLLPACGVNAPHKRERIWIVAYSGKGRIKQEFGRERGVQGKGWQEMGNEFTTNDKKQITSNPTEQGQQDWQSDNRWKDSEEDRAGMDNRPERSGSIRNASDTGKEGCEGNELTGINAGKDKERRTWIPGTVTELHSSSNWLDFPTVSPLRSGDDGLPNRSLRLLIRENSNGLLTEEEENTIISKTISKFHNETIAAGGDAVVPGVVFQIFKAIEQFIAV